MLRKARKLIFLYTFKFVWNWPNSIWSYSITNKFEVGTFYIPRIICNYQLPYHVRLHDMVSHVYDHAMLDAAKHTWIPLSLLQKMHMRSAAVSHRRWWGRVRCKPHHSHMASWWILSLHATPSWPFLHPSRLLCFLISIFFFFTIFIFF